MYETSYFNVVHKSFAAIRQEPPMLKFWVIWGDVNSDEKVDEKDLQLLKDYVNGKIKEDKIDLCVADVNGDNTINIKDVECINDYLKSSNRTGKVKEVISKPINPPRRLPFRTTIHTDRRKPVIYLYPSETIAITVNLNFNGKLTCSYPQLNKNRWIVTAEPDGQLTDMNGTKYNYLFWEGISNVPMNFDTGFCVAGKDTAEFLQEKLSYLGLNSREINEFIVYWLPQMQDNPYNVIAFQTKNYEESAVLDVTPVPETTIRVFMAWKKADNKVAIAPQKIVKAERKGYTLVEWGGCEVVENSINNKFE